jgi:hypothetical protein
MTSRLVQNVFDNSLSEGTCDAMKKVLVLVLNSEGCFGINFILDFNMLMYVFSLFE